MKNTKSYFFPLVVILGISVLFAFKNEEQKKEYGVIYYQVVNPKIFLKLPNTDVKEIGVKQKSKLEAETNDVVNSVAAEDWSVVSSHHTYDGAAYVLERTKR